MARALCIHLLPASRKPFLAGANVTASDLHVHAGCGVNALSGLRMAQESVGLISVAHQAFWRWS
ncbi:hypothetical protein ERAG_01497 [Escherichia coli R424]|nr:hypothetical protein ERAG_01497 [Escherichia coli R424]